jgi:RNA polymerase-binding transcription factor DksA
MLTENEIGSFKSALEKERALLEKELETLGTRNPSNPSDWIPAKPQGDEFGADRNDNADIIEDMEDNNASLNELEGRLNTVIAALAKIEEGTYGLCEVCGADIEPDRLAANPAAPTCKAHME